MNPRIMGQTIVAIAVLVSLISPVSAVAHESNQGSPPGPYVPGEVIVVFESGKDLQGYAASAQELGDRFGAQVAKVNTRGATLLRADPTADVGDLARKISARPDVRYAEPNYIFAVPDPAVEDTHANTTYSRDIDDKGTISATPTDLLRAMKYKKNGSIKATYPNDPNLWDNNGWDWIQADVIWSNTTASPAVCILDTGVDYTHQDLTTTRVLKGKDWVNNDADPMDDNGHGTHVAGIITAIGNNGKGIMGVSNGKVVAVKVLNAQGWGTSYDIAQGIYECANRTDVKILSMSLGSYSVSTLLHDAVSYAVNTKGKLLVAAAGNDDVNTPLYPAGWSVDFPGKVMAVGALGQWVEVDYDLDGTIDWYEVHNECKADYSNYGDSWVNMWAPGTDILSTTPWDKPFWLNTYEDVSPRYGWLSGTSMATPFVAGAAARTWGLFTTYTNTQIFARVRGNARSVWPSWNRWVGDADDVCWPATTNIDELRSLTVSGAIRRGFIRGNAYDAKTGNPLVGATVQVYTLAGTLAGSGMIPTYTYTCATCTDKWVDVWFDSGVNIVNLPAADDGTVYRMKITKSGYTNGSQRAFLDDLTWGYDGSYVRAGWGWADIAAVPPMSSDHTFVVDWDWDFTENDLDLNVWLPNLPKPVPDGQPSTFIVGPEGDAFGYLEDDSAGAMTVFPFARWNRDGGWSDWLGVESVTIRYRTGYTALPYYTGEYTAMLTDYGQWVDLDESGVEDPGEALLGQDEQYPRLQIWQGGKVKLTMMMTCGPAHWWKAASISSGATGAATYTAIDTCSDDATGFVPYSAAAFGGRSEIQK